MQIPRNMLVETVMERKGERFEVVGTQTVMGEKSNTLYRKVPIMKPVGVFVGINDHSIIRLGFSKCKLPPAIIPEEILCQMRPEFITKYEDARRNSDVFNKDNGIAMAMRNMLVPSKVPTGRGFAQKYAAFKQRCIRYFKDVPAMDVGGKIEMIDRDSAPKAEVISDLSSLMKMVETIMGPINVTGSLWNELNFSSILPQTEKPIDPASELSAMRDSYGQKNRTSDGHCNCAGCKARRTVTAEQAEAAKKVTTKPIEIEKKDCNCGSCQADRKKKHKKAIV
jgi:hypothetical protein